MHLVPQSIFPDTHGTRQNLSGSDFITCHKDCQTRVQEIRQIRRDCTLNGDGPDTMDCFRFHSPGPITTKRMQACLSFHDTADDPWQDLAQDARYLSPSPLDSPSHSLGSAPWPRREKTTGLLGPGAPLGCYRTVHLTPFFECRNPLSRYLKMNRNIVLLSFRFSRSANGIF